MPCLIAQLIHPKSMFRRRFIWRSDTDMVTVLRYNPTGHYDGLDRRAGKATVRRLWADYLDNGWIKCHGDFKVYPHDVAAMKQLEGRR